jgi:Protein of unknown function (DUF2934)
MGKRNAIVEKLDPAQPVAEKMPKDSPSRTTSASRTGKPASKSKSLSQEEIRIRAYQRWEAAGKPCSDGINFWLEAEKELLQAKQFFG